jgi:anti-sigma B factor antagonist
MLRGWRRHRELNVPDMPDIPRSTGASPPPSAPGRSDSSSGGGSSAPFHVDVLSTDGVHRFVLRGELDLAGAPILRDCVAAACNDRTRAVRLDLRKLDFIDSSGLYALLKTRELCTERGWEFALVGSTPAVRRMFEVAGVADLLEPHARD